MQLIDIIGTLAAILTTASFVPQAWHTFRTRDVRGISLVSLKPRPQRRCTMHTGTAQPHDRPH